MYQFKTLRNLTTVSCVIRTLLRILNPQTIGKLYINQRKKPHKKATSHK